MRRQRFEEKHVDCECLTQLTWRSPVGSSIGGGQRGWVWGSVAVVAASSRGVVVVGVPIAPVALGRVVILRGSSGLGSSVPTGCPHMLSRSRPPRMVACTGHVIERAVFSVPVVGVLGVIASCTVLLLKRENTHNPSLTMNH